MNLEKEDSAIKEKALLKYLLLKAAFASLKAAEVVLDVYRGKDFQIELKDDNSPVTFADKESHKVIAETLSSCSPSYPILSEEGKRISWEVRASWKRVWVVDPLDGTKEFIEKNGQFGINLALVEEGTPVLGVVQVPTEDLLFLGGGDLGAYRVCQASGLKSSIELGAFEKKKVEETWESITSRARRLPSFERRESAPLRAVVSRSHFNKETEEFLKLVEKKLGPCEIERAGSATKLCSLSEGKADFYPRFAPTKEWDTAAGDAILRETGGGVFRADDLSPLRYNKEQILNPYFIACSRSFLRALREIVSDR